MIKQIIEGSSSSSSSNSNMKLRDLIKNIRACKTQQEERSLVKKEKAAIRESFSNNEAEYRPRNVAKLLFIHMLGHDTDFGQMECLNLITASTFTEKRIGYLGLTQLFHERSELLMMATHRIQNDLKSSSNYIISLAIIAVSEICTKEMVSTFTKEIANIMSKGTSFVKKKAALCASKIIKLLPETIEQFTDKIDKLMEDRHHGVLLSTLGLIEEITYNQPHMKEHFRKYFSTMIKVLKGLSSSYSAEFDVSGISDPYLQIQILTYFRLMAEGNKTLSEEVSDTLSTVVSTTSSNKNTGNAVLFECVRTIMAIESTNAQKTLGINVLGKFLTHKDANSKYCSLFMLKQVLNYDINSVAKHKTMIMDCLKENDSSIKQLALDLTYLISNESNIKQIIKELLNYLLNVNDQEFLKELTLKICLIVDKHSPSKRWYIDTVVKVLTLAGNYTNEESTSLLIHLICSAEELQPYAISKLYYSLTENIDQRGLAKATLYILGEFAQKLTQGQISSEDGSPIIVSESEVINLIGRVFDRVNMDDSIKEYGLNALIKLYSKFPGQGTVILDLIEKQSHSTFAEVQKRACEYKLLAQQSWNDQRSYVCGTIPVYEAALENFNSRPNIDNNREDGESAPQPVPQTSAAPAQDADLIDLMGDLETTTTTTTNQTPQQQTTTVGGGGLLDDLLDTSIPVQTSQPVQQNLGANGFGNQSQPVQQQPVSGNPLDDLMGFGQAQAPVQQVQQQQQNNHQVTIYTDSNIQINLNCTNNANVIDITASFNNNTVNQINNLEFKVAVQKHLTLQLNGINQSYVAPNSQNVTQQTMKVTNKMQGEKEIVLKVIVGYQVNGQSQQQQLMVKDFPKGW